MCRLWVRNEPQHIVAKPHVGVPASPQPTLLDEAAIAEKRATASLKKV